MVTQSVKCVYIFTFLLWCVLITCFNNWIIFILRDMLPCVVILASLALHIHLYNTKACQIYVWNLMLKFCSVSIFCVHSTVLFLAQPFMRILDCHIYVWNGISPVTTKPAVFLCNSWLIIPCQWLSLIVLCICITFVLIIVMLSVVINKLCIDEYYNNWVEMA